MEPGLTVRALSRREQDTADFWRLLWYAVEVDQDALRRIHDVVLPALEVIGHVDQVVRSFVAFRPEASRVVIEYIAVDEARRGAGLGTELLTAVADLHARRPLVAQTDDDAIGFYRALGFRNVLAPTDPRWPERRRYDCVLEARG